MKNTKKSLFRRYLERIQDLLTIVKLIELFFKIYAQRYIGEVNPRIQIEHTITDGSAIKKDTQISSKIILL